MPMRVFTIFLAFIFISSCDNLSMSTKNVKIDDKIDYFLHDPHYDPEKVSGDLLNLVYEIPYFGACGIFPPYHLINIWFKSGGGDGGMSPGASWEPFEVDEDTYSKLTNKIKSTDPEILLRANESFFIKFDFDTSFDHITERELWVTNVCKKHRENYLHKSDLLKQRKKGVSI